LNIVVQRGWVDDLVSLFNDAKVYIYDSADYWASRCVSEGFGLPPIEALACGCVVFSSLNHALADLLDPGLIAHQIGMGTLAGDVDRISAAVRNPDAWSVDPEELEPLLAGLSEEALLKRWQSALIGLNEYWNLRAAGHGLLRSDWLRRQPVWNRAMASARRLAKLLPCVGRSVG
jgi:glycosyltransferase involved in cell wall biosynthesis